LYYVEAERVVTPLFEQ